MDTASHKEVIQLMLLYQKQVQHLIGVKKDSMTLYHQQNGHSVLMYDHSFMEQIASEQTELLTVSKTYYGLQ